MTDGTDRTPGELVLRTTSDAHRALYRFVDDTGPTSARAKKWSRE